MSAGFKLLAPRPRESVKNEEQPYKENRLVLVLSNGEVKRNKVNTVGGMLKYVQRHNYQTKEKRKKC